MAHFWLRVYTLYGASDTGALVGCAAEKVSRVLSCCDCAPSFGASLGSLGVTLGFSGCDVAIVESATRKGKLDDKHVVSMLVSRGVRR